MPVSSFCRTRFSRLMTCSFPFMIRSFLDSLIGLSRAIGCSAAGSTHSYRYHRAGVVPADHYHRSLVLFDVAQHCGATGESTALFPAASRHFLTVELDDRLGFIISLKDRLPAGESRQRKLQPLIL